MMCRQRWYFSKLPKFEEIGGNSMWFPYAEKFMAKYPWFAVRVFYVLLKIKEFFKC